MMADEERRSSPRVRARLRVKFRSAESFINEYTHNISKGGLFIRTSNPHSMREKVDLIITLPDTNIEVLAQGEVIHIILPENATEQTPAGMGLQILELKKEDLEKINQFMQAHASQKVPQ